MRLQTIVSREVGGTETAIVTVGALRAGTKENIIPDRAELLLSVRTADDAVRRRTLDAVVRIVRAEAVASGADRDPEITFLDSLPVVRNDEKAVARTLPALRGVVGPDRVFDPGLITGSEDVGLLAEAASAASVYWVLGGADPAEFAAATTTADIIARVAELPSNHSPLYAPVVEPTLGTGTRALAAAARAWLPPSR
jgi:hippurate hydrolase